MRVSGLTILNKVIFFIIILLVVVSFSWWGGSFVKAHGQPSETYLNGIKPSFVISNSMEPNIMTNALILVEQVPFESLKLGDIIMYHTDKYGMVVHRIIEKVDIGYITKGDNNPLKDNWVVTNEMYKSRVFKVYNELAPIVTYLFGDFTVLKPERIVVSIILIVFLISILAVILNFLFDFITIPLFLKRDTKKGITNALNLHYNHLNYQINKTDLESVLLELSESKNIIRNIIYKYRVMKLHNALKQEEKYTKKVYKRYKKLRRI